jgi:hypothetical protein
VTREKKLHGLESAINTVLKDLEASPGKDAKLYRSALLVFLKSDGTGVYFDEFKKIGINAQDDDAAVRKLIHRLGKKFQPLGYKIHRRSIYDIVLIDDQYH